MQRSYYFVIPVSTCFFYHKEHKEKNHKDHKEGIALDAFAPLLLFCYFYNVETNQQTTSRWKAWIKKLGFIGFLFFLLKGLAWLAIGYFIIK